MMFLLITVKDFEKVSDGQTACSSLPGCHAPPLLPTVGLPRLFKLADLH
jgi:hypothetical protein